MNALYIMKIYGSELKKVFSAEVPLDQPAWSGDGENIAFIKDMGSRTEIWIVNSKGGNPVQVTGNDYRDERPVFSPDNKKLLFMSNREGTYRIYVMNIDGSEVSKIVTPSNTSSNHLVFPVWSPDGTKIAYSENNLQNRKAQIMVLTLADQNLSVLTEQGGRNENPCFSPDGSKIVFQSERDGNFEIYSMNYDGSNPVRLTDSAGWDGWAVWASPLASD
jgi:TolB protein